MLKIRNMVIKDTIRAIELTDSKNWDLTAEDFKLMMELEPEGCFVVIDDSKLIGLATTVSFESLGWIGNVIVDPDFRNRGIGSLLIRHSIRYLEQRGVVSIGLYSYEDTAPFYGKLGFLRDENYIYLIGSGVERPIVQKVKLLKEEDLNRAIELDKRCIGVSRERLLRRIYTDSRNLCHALYEGDDLVGFVMGARSSRTVEIGPLICETCSEQEALALLNVLLRKFKGFKVSIGVPEKKLEIVATLKRVGFRENFKVIRMYYGTKLQDTGCIFAIESLERG